MEYEYVDLSTGISWHAADPKKKRVDKSDKSAFKIQAFQCAYEKTQAAVNSVLQKANQACFERVLDYFIQHTTSTKYPHFIPYQPFPVAAVIAGTDAGAASSALWTDPMIRRLKHRFPFIVTFQRKVQNGRQMLEYVANAVFAEIQKRELESQWLQYEMRRKEKQLTTRRAYRLKELQASDAPNIKWDTVATILKHIAAAVTPVMQLSDDVTIQVDMLHMELQSAAEAVLQAYDSYDASCIHLDRMLQDSLDRIRSVRTLVGYETLTERKLLEFHQWLLVQYKGIVENQLKIETSDAKRNGLRLKMRGISKEMTPQLANNEANASSPCVLLVLDQYETIPESLFADFLHMWRDHAPEALRIGFVLGFSSTFSPCYRRMPRPIATCIYMEPFVLEDSFKSFKDIVQTLVIAGEFPITISGAVYEWLHDAFTHMNSIETFMEALRYILYEHVSAAPHNILPLFPLPDLKELGFPHSVEAYIKNIVPPDPEVTVEAVDQIRTWKHVWQCMWSCVDMTWHMCTQFQPSWAAQNAKVVSLALDGRLSGSTVAGHIYTFLHQGIKDNRIICTDDVVAGVRVLHSLVLEWRDCISRYEMDECMPSDYPVMTAAASAINDMVQILAFVQETANDEMTAKMIPEVREDVWKLLEEKILPCLCPPLPRACSAGRFFFFDRVEALQNHLASHHEVALRKCLETALPQNLRHSWSHDMYIMYDFYRHTAGMLLNVAEWLDHFKQHVPDKTHLQPRFLRVLSTLEYLGFIRRYGKTDDYVEKLVFL